MAVLTSTWQARSGPGKKHCWRCPAASFRRPADRQSAPRCSMPRRHPQSTASSFPTVVVTTKSVGASGSRSASPSRPSSGPEGQNRPCRRRAVSTACARAWAAPVSDHKTPSPPASPCCCPPGPGDIAQAVRIRSGESGPWPASSRCARAHHAHHRSRGRAGRPRREDSDDGEDGACVFVAGHFPPLLVLEPEAEYQRRTPGL